MTSVGRCLGARTWDQVSYLWLVGNGRTGYNYNYYYYYNSILTKGKVFGIEGLGFKILGCSIQSLGFQHFGLILGIRKVRVFVEGRGGRVWVVAGGFGSTRAALFSGLEPCGHSC